MTKPWTLGALPTDCPRCTCVSWYMPESPPSECEYCGAPLRLSGSDNKPFAWYADLCENARLAILNDAIERLRN